MFATTRLSTFARLRPDGSGARVATLVLKNFIVVLAGLIHWLRPTCFMRAFAITPRQARLSASMAARAGSPFYGKIIFFSERE